MWNKEKETVKKWMKKDMHRRKWRKGKLLT